jgi:hypothetical protein
VEQRYKHFLYVTKFIRGQSLYGDKVYTEQSSYSDKVYTTFFYTLPGTRIKRLMIKC